MGCKVEPVVIIWCWRDGFTSEMVPDPGVHDLEIMDNSELTQLDWGAEVKTSSGSGSDGSDVGSDGVKSGWPAKKSRLSSIFDNSELDPTTSAGDVEFLLR